MDKRTNIYKPVNNKIYWLVSYKNAISEEYKQDPTLIISDNDIHLVDREFNCLLKHNFKIVKFNYDFGFVILEDKIKTGEDITKTYKYKDLVPYVEFKPVQTLCTIEGVLTGYQIP